MPAALPARTPEEETFPHLGDWSAPGPVRGAGVMVQDAHGRLLMQLRDDFPHVAAPGQWGFFGGGVEAGETLRIAAWRELAEETGLRPDPAALDPFAAVVTDGPRRVRLYLYRVRLDVDPATLRLGEGAGFAFLTLAQLDRHPVQPCLAPVIARHRALPATPGVPGSR